MRCALVVVVSIGMAGVAHGQAPAKSEWPVQQQETQRDALEASTPVLVRLHLANALGASLGRLAERKGTSPEVRRLGRLVEADLSRADEVLAAHTWNEARLDLYAVTRVVDHTRALRRHVSDTRARLAALEGGAFDAAFVEMMKHLPDEVMELLGEGWQAVPDPQLRAEIRRSAALLRQHQEIANSLASGRARG